MELKQYEIEKAHDAILKYLKTKGNVSTEGILDGINKYYKDRGRIIAELKSKGLIDEHVTEHEEYFGYGFGKDRKPYIRREYTYSISPEGREFIRKGGFKKIWWLNLASNWERILMFLFAAISVMLTTIILTNTTTSSPENKSPQQGEEVLSKPDTSETGRLHLENDTTNLRTPT